MNKIIKNALILMAITLVSGLCLGFVYDITKGPIAEGEKNAQQEAYQKVFPEMSSMEPIYEGDDEMKQVQAESAKVLEQAELSACSVKEAYRAMGEDGTLLGVVVNITTSEGYGGDINFSMGITLDGTINGIEILSIGETAGLGMRATEEEFKGQFAGKKAETLTVTKSGAEAPNEIDAISGATITSKAMTGGVNAGISYYQNLTEGGALNE